ncbi:MAG: multidrug effflux MFS transporter [Microbacteriaceae bacterium]|nr:multidrug effflux MFS transporter [Microbacteriaceae bacterium]MCL2795523.1 multidrug effflux MFS transporter [Microbacteriaceae bacterium]
MSSSTARPRVGLALSMTLMVLAVFGPISMDLYLPALPALTRELGASTSVAQFTITACLVGLAAGQIIAGPLSDRFGRRVPLLIGVAAFAGASLLCAISPTVETLILARFVQGLAGAVGIVISQAAGRDVYDGGALIRYYGRLTVIAGLAAIVGPVIGGQLVRVTDWRGLFVFLSAVGAALLALVLVVFRETLPAERRASGGARDTGRAFRSLLTDRQFVCAVLITGFTFAAIFAYLAGATYILQGVYGLSPQGYSAAFGLNSAGVMLFGWLGARAAERWSVRGTLVVGLVAAAAGAGGLLATGLLHLPLPVVICSLFLLVAGGAGLSSAPTTSLALADHPEFAGTASSLLGMARYAFGGIAAPLVGLGGGSATLPLGIVTTSALVLAIVFYLPIRTRIRTTTRQKEAACSPSTPTPPPQPTPDWSR